NDPTSDCMAHQIAERAQAQLVHDPGPMIFHSSHTYIQACRNVLVAAAFGATVLILGETGTGKELIARAIHRLSTRKRNTFTKVNCSAIPIELLESELFGHEKGAFTGAINQRRGRFELAHQGTVLLDEIGDLPLAMQPKLLHVLEEGEFERLGDSHTHRVDVRVIAATNNDLAQGVAQSQFRADLYYRLNVFPIRLPPLRERREDISPLAWHFVQRFARNMNKHIENIAPDSLNFVVNSAWPGNIRELENLMERSVLLADNCTLHVLQRD
ncbi:MAG TPA: sigma 54-interacting transcriptional regulator, partial [Terriglobales bacterium]|nr:sigma 54-interacting transcriptional regulator [Terriglobales bacterium]